SSGHQRLRSRTRGAVLRTENRGGHAKSTARDCHSGRPWCARSGGVRPRVRHGSGSKTHEQGGLLLPRERRAHMRAVDGGQLRQTQWHVPGCDLLLAQPLSLILDDHVDDGRGDHDDVQRGAHHDDVQRGPAHDDAQHRTHHDDVQRGADHDDEQRGADHDDVEHDVHDYFEHDLVYVEHDVHDHVEHDLVYVEHDVHNHVEH